MSRPSSQQRRADRRRVSLNAYLVSIGTAGCVLLVALIWHDARQILDLHASVALLAAFVVAGELLPIRIPGQGEEITTSGPFMYALLLTHGLAVAATVQVAASVIADIRARKGTRAVSFNAGQFALSLAGAAAVLALLGQSPSSGAMAHLEPSMLLALLPAATVFFALNNALAGTAAALDQGASIRSFLREDLRFQMMMAATVAAFAPLVTAVAVHAEFLIPLLAVPLVALHRGSRAGRLSEHRALHDSLTQLPNRSHFRKLAQQAVSTATREGRAAAVLVMDLDRFKEINDTLGHHSGDLLLQQVGPRLRTVLRPDDVVARFGGDEFAVLIREVDGHEQLVSLGRRIVEALERPFAVEGIQLNVSASVGIVCAPADGTDVDTLLQRGDVAMYNAKRERAGWAFYDSARDDHSIERLALAGELRLALDRHELVLHYQPQIDMRTGRVFGVEALARWQHPERGLLLPASFIPLAEHTGLMREVTTAVMSLAVAQSAAWQAAGLDLQVSFNASSRDVLDQGLVTDLQELLDTHDVRADSLCLEITETMLMADPHRAQQTLQQLSSAGVRIAVDDFGTGYSSLAYLKRLPIDEIKIDRSFVMNMADDRSDAVIVASTIELAHSLGLSALAEGVEGQAAYDELVRLGCEKAQGYFFSRPIPAHTLLAWVEEWDTVPSPDAERAAAGAGAAVAPAIAHA